MSGHSKWSTIKRKKGAEDAKRGKIFTKMAKEIIIAARDGGGDADMNPRLRLAIQRAKSVNMPNDNIKRAIQRGTGDLDSAQIEEVTYEAYAQGGIAFIIECMTDNKNRTLPEVRNVVTRSGGNLADKGSVSYMFDKKGVFVIDGGKYSEDAIMDIVLDFDVDDISPMDDKTIEVIVDPSVYDDLNRTFEEKGIETLSADLTMLPSTSIEISDKASAQKIINFVEKLEDLDDVQNVYGNYDIPEELYKEIDEEG